MGVSIKHVLEQGPALRTLGSTALAAILNQKRPSTGPVAIPGPWIEATLPPRSPELVSAFVRHVGGDPSWYRGRLPANLFPQWSFALAAKAIASTPYPLIKALNAGCAFEQRAAIPMGESLHVRARLVSVDDDGRRAILTTEVLTGTSRTADALRSEFRVFVPLASGKEAKSGEKRERRASVPADARELAFLKINADAGLDFAKLTGDFNPIHWVQPYAKAAGFRSCILHGFSTFARAVEALNRAVFAGDVSKLASIDVRFTRPLPLPARVGVYVTDQSGLFVGDAPAGGAYLEGRYSARPNTEVLA